MRTTTDAKNWKFYFTITDAARFLGKSPVTLRGWERKGLVTFPRDSIGGDRRFDIDDLRALVATASNLGRINTTRERLVGATLTMIEMVERENAK